MDDQQAPRTHLGRRQTEQETEGATISTTVPSCHEPPKAGPKEQAPRRRLQGGSDVNDAVVNRSGNGSRLSPGAALGGHVQASTTTLQGGDRRPQASMSSVPTRDGTRLSPAATHLHPLHLARHLAASEQGGVTEANPHLRATKSNGEKPPPPAEGEPTTTTSPREMGHAAGRSGGSRKRRHLGHRSRRASVDRAKPPPPRGQIRADPAPVG